MAKNSNKSAKELLEELNEEKNKTIKTKKSNKVKNVLTTTALVLTAGAIVITPIVVYRKKNEIYEISIHSEVSNFDTYTITLKNGATISNLKDKLNVIEGHVLVGIYKDKECTIPYANSDKITKNTSVYLKYEKIKYSVTLPNSKKLSFVCYDPIEEGIEWGSPFKFSLTLNEGYEDSDITVKSNGTPIEPDTNGIYLIGFMDQNVKITVEGLKIYSINNIPDQVTVTRANGDVVVDNTELDYGETLKFTYQTSENHTMSSFKINGETVYNGFELKVEEDVVVTYTEFVSQLIVVKENDDGSYEFSGSQEATGDYTIPETIENKPITSIGEGAFKNNSTIISVQIPDSVTSIGKDAFSGCDNLTEIEIPETVTEIGEGAFEGCENLTEVEIPNSVTVIKPNAFKDSGISSIEIPETVIEIGEGAFDGIDQIIINSGSIYSQITNYTIYYNLFGNSKELIFPRSVVESGTNEYLTNYQNFYMFERTDDFIFREADINNTSYTVPEGTIRLAANTFEGHQLLTTVTLPEGLQTIGHEAFQFCTVLDNVEIPSSVKTISGMAFRSCEGLTTVTFAENSQLTSFDTAFYGSSITEITIPSGVTYIDMMAFEDCTKLQTVTFAENSQLREIQGSAFNNCTSLKSIEIPASVNHFGSSVFSGCSSLTEITIPAGVTDLSDEIFSNCSSLETVTFAENSQLETIGRSAFSGSGITSISLPASVTTIDDWAFLGCSNLKEVTIHSATIYSQLTSAEACGYLIANATEIKVPKLIVDDENKVNTYLDYYLNFYKFEISENDKDYYLFVPVDRDSDVVSIPDGVTKIVSMRLSKMEGTINVPASVVEICDSAFYSSLVSKLIFAENSQLEIIGDNAFNTAIWLNDPVFPETVTTIGKNAFSGCGSVFKFVIPESLTSWHENSFDFSSLWELTIHSSDYYNAYTNESIPYSNDIEVKIHKDIYSDSHPYLNATNFDVTEDGDYYVYTVKTYAINNIPEQVTITNSLGQVLTTSSRIHSGEEIHFAFQTIDNIAIETIKINGEFLDTLIALGWENYVVTENLNIEYTTVNTYGLNFSFESRYGMCVDGYDSEIMDIIVPKTINNITVSYFYNSALRGATLNSLLIPSSIVQIIEGSFIDCSIGELTIESVQVYNMLTAIDACEGLITNTSQIKVPKSIVDDEDNINDFLNNSLYFTITEDRNYYVYTPTERTEEDVISEVVIPDGTTVITADMFDADAIIGNLIIPASVTTIEEDAFDYCTIYSLTIESSSIYGELTTAGACGWILSYVGQIKTLASIDDGSNMDLNMTYYKYGITENEKDYYLYDQITFSSDVIVPDGVTTILESSFQDNLTIESVFIPASVTSIEAFAFQNCSSLTTVEFESGSLLTQIGQGAFQNCLALENINLDAVNNLAAISNSVFYNCYALESLILPNGVTHFNVHAFVYSGLKSLVVPSSVELIGVGTFYDCTNLKSVTIESATIYSYLTSAEACGYLIANATEIKIMKDFYNESHSYLNSDNFLIFESEDYMHFVPISITEEGVEYTGITTDGTNTYLSTADNPYHTLLY